MSGPSHHPHRLAGSSSPYLLQHADNPVHWYPWGEEAFAAAAAENKPVFLSIGYTTCHWCHVMAHESFEDDAVAALLNDRFIAVKVDREERPDIDQIYMAVCQMMTGAGGWPLTIVMSPDKRPFFAATYIPKEPRFGRFGMLDLLPKLADAWASDRDKIDATASAVIEALSKGTHQESGDDLSPADLSLAAAHYRERFDARNGGFGSKPKFPSPHQLIFLLRQHYRTGDGALLEMVESTLTGMRNGGLFDQVGFGFHRYSTDEFWLVPHFEKMLYDQAMLLMAYTEAYQATGNPAYQTTAQEIITYVARDMTSSEGLFYSAEDADSEGEEGKFYLWRMDELQNLLSPDEVDFLITHLNIRDEGNFVDEATQQQPGTNILHLTGALTDEQRRQWEPIREKLLDHRAKRVRPELDDKVLTDWNGLMIAALAQAGLAFNNSTYIEMAEKATTALLANMRQSNGRLLHRYRRGQAGIKGHLDDYAFLTWGLLNLYEATFDLDLLRVAIELMETADEHYWDADQGGFYFTADDGESLLIRNKDWYDGAIPSGNSVMAMNLLRLSHMTGKMEYAQKAAGIGRLVAGQVAQVPTSFTYLLCAVAFEAGPQFEVVLTGHRDSEDMVAMLAALRQSYHPQKVVLFRHENNPAPLADLAPFTAQQVAQGGKATAYVCQNHACKAPTTSAVEMLDTLERAQVVTP
ncbi:MAG: thioredoxin domain-containing protein [Candidatus Marinimicrobia bacterium]|nr:thioredoxin domain-containing protein [Candidatus Neomarinimicrobiota bacterium]